MEQAYEVVGPLGRGATGFVFKIRDRKKVGKFYVIYKGLGIMEFRP
jgi:hypothetical protein